MMPPERIWARLSQIGFDRFEGELYFKKAAKRDRRLERRTEHCVHKVMVTMPARPAGGRLARLSG